jgi:hypothetical protein
MSVSVSWPGSMAKLVEPQLWIGGQSVIADDRQQEGELC